MKLPTLALLLLLVAPARAGDEDRLQDQLTQYTVIVADLEKSDAAGVATTEIAKLKAWLSQAQTKLATGDEDVVEILVRRFKPEVRYVRAILERTDIEAKLKAMQEEEDSLGKEAKKLKTRAAELDKRRKELQAAVESRKGDQSGGFKAVPAFGGGR